MWVNIEIEGIFKISINSLINLSLCFYIVINVFHSYLIKIFPVISFGISNPIMCKIVGEISPSFPFSILLYPVLTIKHGTKFLVCEVLGVPSSLIVNSAFP